MSTSRRAAGDRDAVRPWASRSPASPSADYADLAPPEQARPARELPPFAEGRGDDLDDIRVGVERIWIRGLGVAVVLHLAGLAGRTGLAEKVEQRRDLAKGSPAASSRYPDAAAPRPRRKCLNSDVHFPTVEQNDLSIEFDLGASRRSRP